MEKKANRGHLQTKLELCRRRHVRRLHHLQVLAAAPVAAVVPPLVLRDPLLRFETFGLREQWVKGLK